MIFLKYQFKTVLSQQESVCNRKAVGQTNGLVNSGLVNSGGDKRDRTADLLNAIQALSQLSYTPILYIYLTKERVVCQVTNSIISQQSNVGAEIFHTV